MASDGEHSPKSHGQDQMPVPAFSRAAFSLSTGLAGVIGWPVAHSLSPRLHNFWLQRYGIDGAYLPFALAPEDLGRGIEGLRILGFRGFNVTMPHKEAVFHLVDRLTPVARRAGAVNTVTISAQGLLGDNSDGVGFCTHLKAATARESLDGMRVMLLGAGGAARAIAAALLSSGAASLICVNRNQERAERLAQELGSAVAVASWAQGGARCAGCDLLINTTSLGMTGAPPLEFTLEALPRQAFVADIISSPLETPLLRSARARGHPTADGLDLLMAQAVAGFSAWFGRCPQVDQELRRFLTAKPAKQAQSPLAPLADAATGEACAF